MVSTQNKSRNMTGIYLGLEGRGHSQKRCFTLSMSRAKGNAASAQTPTEERRYRMIDMLRIKEESRGFRGKTLKTQKFESENRPMTPRNQKPPEQRRNVIDNADIIALIKMNHRHFTAIRNSGGITRYENLMSDEDIIYDVTHDLHEMFHANYNTNNNNYSSSFIEDDPLNITKLPQTPRRMKTVQYTGFTVKSYQNPNPAHILAAFPDPRPGTVPASYFTRHGHPIRSSPRAQSGFTRHIDAHRTSSGSALGGSYPKLTSSIGVRSYTRQTHRAIPSPSTYLQQRQTPRRNPTSVTFDPRDVIYSDGAEHASSDSENNLSSMNGVNVHTKPMVINMKKADVALEEGSGIPPSPTATMFVVEDEDGITKNIEIEEVPTQVQNTKFQRQESEEILAVLKEHAEQRQKKFAQLLDEHKEIVQEIGRISSSDCIVTQTERD